MTSNKISKVFLFFRRDGRKIAEQQEARAFITEKGRELGIEIVENIDEIDGSDLVVTVGGDGTFLAGASMAFERNIPIAGINVGQLGFLAEINPCEKMMITNLLKGEFDVKQRMMMDVRLLRNGTETAAFTALNEVTIIRDINASPMLCFGIEYNGEEMPQYKCDGLIAATPTGSTAYNLSCNGPIIYPAEESFVINAVAPHALTHRPIVLPASGSVKVTLKECVLGFLTCDGKNSVKVCENDIVLIRRNGRDLSVVSNPERSFFDILSERLHLGKRL
ncbi:NAD(+)/NADH kinase [bacterium]|nr:NAD(+)/NADH kinase [bacterium]